MTNIGQKIDVGDLLTCRLQGSLRVYFIIGIIPPRPPVSKRVLCKLMHANADKFIVTHWFEESIIEDFDVHVKLNTFECDDK